MNSQNLVLVSFNRDQLQMVEFEGQPYVVMKPIVKSLKLDWRTQQAKLLENKKKFNYGLIPILALDGKLRKMGCIPLKKLNGWLFGINPNNIPNLNTRSKVEQYQEECFEVLWNYWSNRSKSPVELLLEEKWKLEHAPVNLLSFEQISYSERLAQRSFTWNQFQEFFGMKRNTWFLRTLIGKINRQILGMSGGRFRTLVLGPRRTRIINGETVRLDIETNNIPQNLTKDFLPKPHQECIQKIMQDLYEYFLVRPNWTPNRVRQKAREFITTRKGNMEILIGRNLHELLLEGIQQINDYSRLHEISPYEVISQNLVQLNYNQLALERELRQTLKV